MIKKLSPNYYSRDGYKVTGIVLHITDSNVNSALSWVLDPKSQVSYHYMVSRYAPYVIQIVDEKNAAWHSGRVINPTWKGLMDAPLGALMVKGEREKALKNHGGEKGADISIIETSFLGGQRAVVNPNKHTIGVAVALKGGEFPDVKQWLETARLVKDISKRHNIPLSDIGVANHFEIRSDKVCPRPWCTRFYIKTLMSFV